MEKETKKQGKEFRKYKTTRKILGKKQGKELGKRNKTTTTKN